MYNEKKYLGIVKHYEECFTKYGDTHKGVDWPNENDAVTRYSVMLDVIKEKKDELTLLDFGCGFAHLYEYVINNNLNFVQYSGLDISEMYYEYCVNKFPGNKFYQMDILEACDNLPVFDYIVMNGVFTEKQDLTFDEMFEYFKRTITVIFDKSRVGMAFDVMSSHVGKERDDLFHLPLDPLSNFLVNNITRSFIIRNDYGLYEYTVYLYK
jgi:SAM-dependent methyltransferase